AQAEDVDERLVLLRGDVDEGQEALAPVAAGGVRVTGRHVRAVVAREGERRPLDEARGRIAREAGQRRIGLDQAGRRGARADVVDLTGRTDRLVPDDAAVATARAAPGPAAGAAPSVTAAAAADARVRRRARIPSARGRAHERAHTERQP